MTGFAQRAAAIVTGLMVTLTLGARTEAGERRGEGRERIVIGHRGASGYLPEHTLAAYRLAVEQGADFIEPDLVITRDGVLVARHENEIGATTDVAQRPEFASRRTTRTVDGVPKTGWFVEDFTLAEIKTLRAIERIARVRPASATFDGRFEVPTLEEILALVEAINDQRRKLAAARNEPARTLGIYPETKHPAYFAKRGLPLEEPLVALLERYGYGKPDDAVFIQSFEVASLRKLARMTKLRLVQLIDASGRPRDFAETGDPRTHADMVKPAGLAAIASYAAGIGAHKDLVIPRVRDALGTPTALVREAHRAGLFVHAWTFRAENAFLPKAFRSSPDPSAHGDLASEIKRFLELGLDGLFADQPDIAVRARDAFVAR